MATIQEIAPAPWRMRLVPASYAGVPFHVEHQGHSGGRRVVLHEYPKRNTPYAEDMGRSAFRYQMTGYILGPSYHLGKEALMAALDNREAAQLMDPYLAEPKMCICERYSVSETRDRGGYCQFEMSFVELGSPGNMPEQTNTGSQVQSQSQTTGDGAAQTADSYPSVVAPSSGGIGHA
jgi:prophage DNA circulation protein